MISNVAPKPKDSGVPEKTYQLGDWVVYRKQKRGNHPGPRAKIIGAAEKGDSYAYLVDKHWVVVRVDGEQLTVRTRRGKLHLISRTDPRLHKASWWERWMLAQRFKAIDATPLENAITGPNVSEIEDDSAE